MGLNWDEAVAYALSLPDAVLATSYGKPAVKLATNDRVFLATGHEPQEAFCLMIGRDRIEMLKETDPDTFFQTPHYVGWDAILVRYDSPDPDPDRVREVIKEARDQAAARKPPKARKKT